MNRMTMVSGECLSKISGRRKLCGPGLAWLVPLPDFTNPTTREWWRKNSRVCRAGVEGFWNDMNELRHGAMLCRKISNSILKGIKQRLAEARNVFGFQMARSTYEAQKNYSTASDRSISRGQVSPVYNVTQPFGRGTMLPTTNT